jgi:hypothetical protein
MSIAHAYETGRFRESADRTAATISAASVNAIACPVIAPPLEPQGHGRARPHST